MMSGVKVPVKYTDYWSCRISDFASIKKPKATNPKGKNYTIIIILLCISYYCYCLFVNNQTAFIGTFYEWFVDNIIILYYIFYRKSADVVVISAIRVAYAYDIVHSPRKRGCQINQNLNYGFPDFLFFFHIIFERTTL